MNTFDKQTGANIMTTRARFPIGLTFVYHGDKQKRLHTINNIYTTRNEAGNIVRLEYLVTYDFCGQRMELLLIDTAIARSLTPEQLKQYV